MCSTAVWPSVGFSSTPPRAVWTELSRLGPAAGSGRARRRGAAASILLVAMLALILSGCGGSGDSLARQACVHVKDSIRLYRAAERTSDQSQASSERTRAIEQLEAALPLAAQANSADPQWNPLMTTLQEIGRNSEAHLILALTAQCALADSNTEQAPVVTTTVPGQQTTPAPSTLPDQ
jgi:hypothetical protein